jgi:hypothetical protein
VGRFEVRPRKTWRAHARGPEHFDDPVSGRSPGVRFDGRLSPVACRHRTPGGRQWLL